MHFLNNNLSDLKKIKLNKIKIVKEKTRDFMEFYIDQNSD